MQITRNLAIAAGTAIGHATGMVFGGVGALPGAVRGGAVAAHLHDLTLGGAKGAIWGAFHGGVGVVPGAALGVAASRDGLKMAAAAQHLLG